MADSPRTDVGPAAAAGAELAVLNGQIARARDLLQLLQQQVSQAHAQLQAGPPDHLLQANEQLMLSVLHAQREAEAAARDIAFRELSACLRLESQRLGEENRQMAEASRLKNQFLSNMSHELRTPLNAILGFSDLLRRGVVSPASPKYVEYLDHIITAGHYLLQLVAGVLDLSKAAAGKLDFSPEPVQLPALVAEVLAMMNPLAARRAVAIETDLSELGELRIDRTRLKQVLINLLTNAVKFSHQQGVVTVRAMPSGDASFRVEVEDRGIGIAAADHQRLFVEFQQLDAGRLKRHEGTGIGLALSRLLVEGQGGTLGLRSALGVGSTFFFVLPRHADQPGHALRP